MQYEELREIWETQRQKPVFSANDFGLHMELYRTRERDRRRRFWGGVFPLFVCSIPLLLFLAVPILEFFLMPPERMPPDEVQMTAWDVLACLAGMALAVFAAWSMYANWRKNEQRQKVFAPSLRQEIELGIALVESEMSGLRSGLAWRIAASLILAAMIMSWEVGRLNDNPAPWESLGITLPVLAFMLLARARKRDMRQKEQRKEALEAMRAKLDENPAES